MDGIALAYSDLPIELIEQHQLERLVYERGGEREFRFLRHVKEAVLPVRVDGELRIVPWGSRTGRLPRSAYTWLKTVEAGEWAQYNVQPVEIPACAGLHNGVWYCVGQGIKGVLAMANGSQAVYMIVEPAGYYYQIMTKGDRMPVLIGESI